MQTSIQQILWDQYLEIKSKRPEYSKRAYASKLNISSGTLSEILLGKRKISKQMALKIAANINLDDDSLRLFLSSFENSLLSNKQNINVSQTQIEMDRYQALLNWETFAILSLIKLDDFKYDEAWIASRINSTEEKVQETIKRLINLGILVIRNTGLVRTQERLTTTDDIHNAAIKNAHSTNMELARKSLYRDDVHIREFQSMTMAIDKKKIKEAKIKIRNFIHELSEFLESDEKNEVYNINLQLFPITVNRQ